MGNLLLTFLRGLLPFPTRKPKKNKFLEEVAALFYIGKEQVW
jgi:hypothetical protein